MKKATYLLLCTLMLLFVVANGQGQGIQEKIEKFGTNYATGYLSPMFSAFGASMNSGWYHTANVDDGLSLFFGAKLMYLPIPDDGKMFSMVSIYDNTVQNDIPTLFGEEVEKPINGAPSGASPSVYPKGLNLGFLPMVMPHVQIGNMYGTRLMLRYFPKTKLSDDIGEFEMFGIGAQHNVGKYIPVENPLPVDIAGMVAYQSLKLGTFFSATSFTFGVQASKSFPVIDLYAGVAYETASMTIGYDATFTDPSNPSQNITQHIGFDADGANTIRGTIGFSLSLAILKINADYSLASQSAATLGIGFGW